MRSIWHTLRAGSCTLEPSHAPLAEQRRIVANVKQLMMALR